MKNAVVLLSGGVDSTTTMAIAKSEGYIVHCISFDYGQRHRIELEAAKRVAAAMDAKKHLIVNIDMRTIGGSALTSSLEVPKERSEYEITHGIPITYVPARNTIFLSYSLAWAEVLPASDIFIGVNVIDYSGYPDCRPEYIKAFENMANLSLKATVEGTMKINIHTPIVNLSKSEIILKGINLGVDYGMTHSCYDPSYDGRACGLCDSCELRQKGFRQAGIADPTLYANRVII